MQEHGGFDHNKQSLRIVTKLEERYPDFRGLNLSWETLEGMVKHETEYDIKDASLFQPDWCASIEAQIANIADETAYNAHDLDDGLRSGLITALDLSEAVPLWRELTESLGLDPKHVSEMDRRLLVREMLGTVITDIVNTTVARIDELGIRTLDDVRHANATLVGHSAELRGKLRELKRFLYGNHYRVVRQVHKAEHFLTTLFQAYTRTPKIMPPVVQARIDSIGLERAVCDYLAGMTDRFAMDEYQRLYEPYVRT